MAEPSAPSRVLTTALTRAREQQLEVLLMVTEPDGAVRYYQALPDGTLHGEGDGGFAEAFTTLHPRLITLADEHGVNLRAVHASLREESTLTAAVLRALAAHGVSSTDLEPRPAFPVTPVSQIGQAVSTDSTSATIPGWAETTTEGAP